MVKIALFQSTTGIDPAANAKRLVAAAGNAAREGAAMLFTPEMSGLLDRNSQRAAKAIQAEEQCCKEENIDPRKPTRLPPAVRLRGLTASGCTSAPSRC